MSQISFGKTLSGQIHSNSFVNFCRRGAFLDLCQPLLSTQAQFRRLQLHPAQTGGTFFPVVLLKLTHRFCSGPRLIELHLLQQGLNNAVALDFDYRQQMIYWTDVTTQGSMIRRMYINGSDVQVSGVFLFVWFFLLCFRFLSKRATKHQPDAGPSFVRSCIAHRSATQTAWQSTGWAGTCTGATRDETPLRCPS